MRISSVKIENFGCIESVSVDFDAYTALIGPNNSGKSTVLKAIDVFFSSSPAIERRHFFLHDENRIISISITFCDLVPLERSEFGNAVIDGKMTVTRTFGGDEDGLFSVEALMCPEFKAFREEGNGNKQRQIYTQLRGQFDLPTATNVADMSSNLQKWEGENPEKLSRVKTRGFFGATNVATGKLKRKTSVRFIAAVAEASEATGKKTSPVIAILSDIRRQTLENKPEFQQLVSNINQSVSAFVDAVDDQRVLQMGKDITTLLNKYYTDTEVSADLPPPNELVVSFPSPALKIRHRSIVDGVENVGHGLQRAVLFAVVQFLAQHFAAEPAAEGDVEFQEAASDIVILVEEPEIYQHPLKQRIIRDVLDRICADFDKITGIRIQVIVCTHSEKFVRIRDVGALRVVRTSYAHDTYQNSVSSLSMERLRDLLFQARGGVGQPLPLATFSAGLHVFSEAVSEGFFAEKVVLVEGVGDVAAIEGAFISKGRDAQMEGIAIIQVDGKTKLDKPLQCYLSLGIKAYCVFDNDQSKGASEKEKRKSYNHLLQKICGVIDSEDFPVGVRGNYAAIECNLERYLEGVVGDQHQALREQVAESFGVAPSDTTKSPATIAAFIALASDKGYVFPFFDQVVDAIDAL